MLCLITGSVSHGASSQLAIAAVIGLSATTHSTAQWRNAMHSGTGRQQPTDGTNLFLLGL